MSFWSRLKQRQSEQVEQRRNKAIEEALARGATPDQAKRAGDRAARRYTNAAITGAINSG
ncbi:hypothetical protein [Rugosimonospora acidiphila]